MCKAVVNEDANAKMIRELREEISRLRDLLKAEGVQVEEGQSVGTLNSGAVLRRVTYLNERSVASRARAV